MEEKLTEHVEEERAEAPAPEEEEELFDPYLMVDPADKEARRRQKRLSRAAKRGEVRILGESEEDFERRAASSRRRGHSRAGASRREGPPKRGSSTGSLVARAVAVAAVVVALAGVGLYAASEIAGPDISDYESVGVSISGIEEEDFIVTPADLAELDCVEQTVTGTGAGPQGESKAGTVTAYGPTLETFLAQYGLETTDFTRINFFCKDGYTVTLARDALEDEAILSLASGDEALAAYQQPLRLVVPDESSGQWCYGVLRIEFER